MRKKTGIVGWMAVKIDHEKAYDRLNWEFIKDTLIGVGLPEKMIDIIWHYVSSLKMKVLCMEWRSLTRISTRERYSARRSAITISLCSLHRTTVSFDWYCY
ncbi:hypothetical protein P8452_43040 [Trifolium repens]|nr:hypothetical protein P8452_43040 [Trifolium repens]